MRLFLTIALFLISGFCIGQNSVSVRFGKIQIAEHVGSGLRFAFVSEEKRVPLLTMNEGGLYGIEYSSPDTHPYRIQVKAITPASIKIQGGDLISVERHPDRVELLFVERNVTGTMVEPFLFSDGDPPGRYVLEVSVNGKPTKRLEYEAFLPSAH